MKYLATSPVLRAGGSKPNPIGAAYRKENQFDRTNASDSALACDSLKRLVKEGYVKKHAGGVYALAALLCEKARRRCVCAGGAAGGEAMKIFKYQIQITDRQTIVMPHDAKILCVQMQGVVEGPFGAVLDPGQACIWAHVEPENKPAKRELRIYGTGHELDRLHGRYVGTFQQAGGALVWHVFDLGEAS